MPPHERIYPFFLSSMIYGKNLRLCIFVYAGMARNTATTNSWYICPISCPAA